MRRGLGRTQVGCSVQISMMNVVKLTLFLLLQLPLAIAKFSLPVVTWTMRQALLFILAMATVACAIMLPDDRNTLPVNWKRSIDSRDAGSASGLDMSDTSIPEVTEHSELGTEQERTQSVWNPCPQFNVKCVLDGDWRHPVGELGPKRASRLLSRVQSIMHSH